MYILDLRAGPEFETNTPVICCVTTERCLYIGQRWGTNLAESDPGQVFVDRR